MGFYSWILSYPSFNLSALQAVLEKPFSQAADANGRPISYVLLEEDAKQLENQDWARVNTVLLKKHSISSCLLKV